MDLSIIISAFNNSYKLKLVLKFLNLQENIASKKIQVIIVDDCSLDDTYEIAMNYKNNIPPFDVKVIRNPKNKGLAASRNIGANASDADLIMFLDNDIIMSKETLFQHFTLHENDFTKKKIVMSNISDVAIDSFDYIIEMLGKKEILEADFLHNYISKSMDPYFSLRNNILNSKEVLGNTMWVFGACFCISMEKKTWQDVGRFDEEFFGWGPEDIEFNYRAYKKGYQLVYSMESQCYHLDNNKKDLSKLVRDVTRNLKYFYEKHQEKDIQNYLRFYKGSITYEELDSLLNGEIFDKSKYTELNRIGILKFLNSKT